MTVTDKRPMGALLLEPTMTRTVLWACKACRAKHPLHPDQPPGLDPTVCAACGEPMNGPQTQSVPAEITSLAPLAVVAKVLLKFGRTLAAWANRI